MMWWIKCIRVICLGMINIKAPQKEEIMLTSVFHKDHLQFDVEYGNSISFYSGVKSCSLPYSQVQIDSESQKRFKWFGELEKTSLDLEEAWLKDGGEVVRNLKFKFKEDSYLYDMVSRFVVYSETPEAALIGRNFFSHRSSNIYYQFENVNKVEIPYDGKSKIVFLSGKSEIPKGFKEVFYIRDEKKTEKGYKWIVHHRLIVDPLLANLILRCCHPKFEGVVAFQDYFPDFLKRKFFRIRESKYPNFPFMTVGECMVSAGEIATIKTKVRVCER